MDKLNKMIGKQNEILNKQNQSRDQQQKTIDSMKEQIKILSAEKQLILDEIKKAQKELADLQMLLHKKQKTTLDRDETIADLENQIDQLFNDMERLEQEIEIKDAIIRDLQNQLNLLLNRKPEPEKPKFQFYVPVKTDPVDVELGRYINEITMGTPVPWKRISESNYIYGTKKVNVKYMRNHLIIKVGGGSMMVEEFVANYEDIELAKMNYNNPGSGVPLNPDQSGLTKQQKVAIARGASPKSLGSPRAGRGSAKKI